MERENFDRTLRLFQKRAPFKTFAVELVSGEAIEIDHPEALVLRGGVAVFIEVDGTPHLFDHESVSRFIGDNLAQSA